MEYCFKKSCSFGMFVHECLFGSLGVNHPVGNGCLWDKVIR